MKGWLASFSDKTTTVSSQTPIWVTRVIRKLRKLRSFRELQNFGNINVKISALAVKSICTTVVQGEWIIHYSNAS